MNIGRQVGRIVLSVDAGNRGAIVLSKEDGHADATLFGLAGSGSADV